MEAAGEGELRHRISYVAVDETEFDLNLHSDDAGVMSDRGMSHVMMIHACVLSRLGDGSSRTDDVVVAPVVLGDITGRTLLSAIQKRCPWISKDIRSGWHVIILGSDSAKSLLLVAKHFKALTDSMPRAIFLHGRYFMHKLWGTFNKMMTMMSVINPMFSATCLTHRTGTMVKIRAAVKAIVSEKLRVHFEPLPARYMERNKAIIKLVNAAEDEWARSEVDATYEHSLPKRVQSRQELLIVCPGDWADSSGIGHVCTLHCKCRNRDDAVTLVTDTICAAFLACRPPIPALNRWNRVFPPLVSWMAFLAFHGSISTIKFFFLSLLILTNNVEAQGNRVFSLLSSAIVNLSLLYRGPLGLSLILQVV